MKRFIQRRVGGAFFRGYTVMEMKPGILSLKELSATTRGTVSRFPLPAFFLCVGMLNHLCMNIYKLEKFEYLSRNIFMCLLLLIPVSYSIRLLYESGWIGKFTGLIMDCLSITAAVLYFYYLPDNPLVALYLSQFAVLFISSILLCFVCVKQGVGDDDFYWNFNAALFIRLAVTALYAMIIIVGTSAALGAIDVLFKAGLYRSNETRIIIITLWIFAPIFFLSGVPLLSGPKQAMGYRPGWLKNIGIYVMVPLTTVYLGILYAYGCKILLQWQLPEGTVSYSSCLLLPSG